MCDEVRGRRMFCVAWMGLCMGIWAPFAGADCAGNVLLNGGFEDTSNVAWTETSGSGFPVIVQLAPHTGEYSAWFGGNMDNEQVTLNQQFTLPLPGTAWLEFYLQMGLNQPGDYLGVFIDATLLFEVTGSTPGYSLYHVVRRDVSSFADGMPHMLIFHAFTTGIFSVDDVCLRMGDETEGETPPGNDLCSEATEVILDNLYPQSNSGANSDLTGVCKPNDGEDVWFRFTPADTDDYSISLCGSLFDTTVSVFSGDCASPNLVACNDDYCIVYSWLCVNLSADTPYLIRVASFAPGEGGVYRLQVKQGCVSPEGEEEGDGVGEGGGEGDIEGGGEGEGEGGGEGEGVAEGEGVTEGEGNAEGEGGGEGEGVAEGEGVTEGEGNAEGEGEGGVEGEIPGQECPDQSVFSQLPGPVNNQWQLTDSSLDFGRAWDSYVVSAGPVQAVRWWGVVFDDGGAPAQCSQFVIRFAASVESPPGDTECEETVVASAVSTGFLVDELPVWRFDAVLDTPCSLSEGWVSVQSDESGKSFNWLSSAQGNAEHAFEIFSQMFFGTFDLSYCLSIVSGEGEGQVEGEGQEEGEGQAEGGGQVEGEGQEEGEGQAEGEGQVEGEQGIYTADQNGDRLIGLSELLRVIQFFNSNGFHCAAGTEDGYAPGTGDTSCAPHDSDYNPHDWRVTLSELLRVIQFFNSGGYHYCPEEATEDGYCVGLA